MKKRKVNNIGRPLNLSLRVLSSFFLSILLFPSLSVSAAESGRLAPERSTAPIVVIWPPEGFAMGPAEGEFILGSVIDPSAPFKINDQAVKVHPDGGFLAWLGVSPGTFTFHCALELKSGATTYDRSILVNGPTPPLPEKPLAIDEASLSPRLDTELRPGDWLIVRMKASPGQSARFRLDKAPWHDMRETARGSYEGAMMAGSHAHGPLPVELELGSGWSSKKAKTSALVSVSAGTPSIAVVKSAGPVYVRTGPGNGFMLFPSSGTRFVTAGRVGPELKVSLSASISGWIDSKDLDLLPPGALPPRAVTGSINVAASGDGTVVRVGLGEKVPFSVEESDDLSGLVIRLFYAYGHTNWIVYDSSDSLVEQVRWRQESEGVVEVSVRLREPRELWGYTAAYDGGALKLELKTAPRLALEGSPLWGRTIFLDPGHMPSATGATGPLGTKEMDVNFALAKAVEALLIKEGAAPILGRDNPAHEVSLIDRPRLAAEKKADVYVSLHNNALPDGENPFARPRGFSVFYYHPHSLVLARELYRSFDDRVPLPGEELRYGNLLVARLTSMPAVLIESAYMTFPEQEEKLNDPAFRGKIAEAVVAGLRSFFAKQRDKRRTRKRSQESQ